MPAEAYNYQFPVGSVRDDMSEASSTISRATTARTQHTEGNQTTSTEIDRGAFHIMPSTELADDSGDR